MTMFANAGACNVTSQLWDIRYEDASRPERGTELAKVCLDPIHRREPTKLCEKWWIQEQFGFVRILEGEQTIS